MRKVEQDLSRKRSALQRKRQIRANKRPGIMQHIIYHLNRGPVGERGHIFARITALYHRLRLAAHGFSQHQFNQLIQERQTA